jgi:hypothetical protein
MSLFARAGFYDEPQKLLAERLGEDSDGECVRDHTETTPGRRFLRF